MEQIHNDIETEEQVTQSVTLLKNIFGNDLLGVYLYGSAVAGGFKAFSDIDLFVVINRTMTSKEKAKLLGALLIISGVYKKSSKRPIEMLIVLKSQVNPWVYPPLFEFQYGEWLREEFERGVIEPWSSQDMPDLALLQTQVMLASKILFGPAPDQLLSKVPYQDVLRATESTVADLMVNLVDDTRNVLLTYARIWAMLMTDSIYPKPEAALWAIKQLPDAHKPIMAKARAICLGEEIENWDGHIEASRVCAEYMMKKIEERLSYLKAHQLLGIK